MTKHYTYVAKQDGDTLSAQEWNNLAQDVDGAVDAINNGSIGGEGTSNVTCTDITEPGGDPKVSVKVATGIEGFAGSSDAVSTFEFTKKVKNNNYKGTNVSLVSNNNINIEPRESVGSTKGGNISLKPGDDIELCSHHRIEDNQNEVSVKVIDGDDNPVKLQINAASVTMTTKDKQGDDANVLDVNINSGKNTKGYLKVRAQAIDLRCEDHGGIAIQPKGEDGQGNMNKIKFEHGGGDGLEFGTFNAEKTSLYTDEYRFNKDGVWKMATRTKQVSDKYDNEDETTHYKYQKQADDFYDVINLYDATATTLDIINTASAFNGETGARVYSQAGTLYIDCRDKFKCEINEDPDIYTEPLSLLIPKEVSDINYFLNNTFYSVEDVGFGLDYNEVSDAASDLPTQDNTYKYILVYPLGMSQTADVIALKFTKMPSAKDVTLTTNSGTCDVSDIIDLINYFKTGAGQASGPWANT